jgi:predicted HTH domain antitoxin
MTVTIEIPENVAAAFAEGGGDLSRTALEAVAVEGYRRNLLGESQLRRMLGFETRMDVHSFLKERGVYLNYDTEDAEHDLAEIRRYGEIMHTEQQAGVRSAEGSRVG